MCVLVPYKNFNVIIIRVRGVPRVKFARKRIVVYFSLSFSKRISLLSGFPFFFLPAGTLISSFSFFMNNGRGRALCAVFAAVAASGQFP